MFFHRRLLTSRVPFASLHLFIKFAGYRHLTSEPPTLAHRHNSRAHLSVPYSFHSIYFLLVFGFFCIQHVIIKIFGFDFVVCRPQLKWFDIYIFSSFIFRCVCVRTILVCCCYFNVFVLVSHSASVEFRRCVRYTLINLCANCRVAKN